MFHHSITSFWGLCVGDLSRFGTSTTCVASPATPHTLLLSSSDRSQSVVKRSHLLCRRLSDNLQHIEYIDSNEHEDACSEAILRTFDAEEISDPATKKNLFQTPKRAAKCSGSAASAKCSGSAASAIVCLTRSAAAASSTAVPYPSSTNSNQVIPFEDGQLSPNKLYFVRHPGGKMRAPDSILFYRSNDNQYHMLYFEYKSNKLRNNTITCNSTNPASEHIYIVNRKLLWSGSLYATESDNLKFERFKSMEARRNRIFRKQGLPTKRPGARKFKLSNFVESKNTSGMVFRISKFLRHLK